MFTGLNASVVFWWVEFKFVSIIIVDASDVFNLLRTTSVPSKLSTLYFLEVRAWRRFEPRTGLRLQPLLHPSAPPLHVAGDEARVLWTRGWVWWGETDTWHELRWCEQCSVLWSPHCRSQCCWCCPHCSCCPAAPVSHCSCCCCCCCWWCWCCEEQEWGDLTPEQGHWSWVLWPWDSGARGEMRVRPGLVCGQCPRWDIVWSGPDTPGTLGIWTSARLSRSARHSRRECLHRPCHRGGCPGSRPWPAHHCICCVWSTPEVRRLWCRQSQCTFHPWDELRNQSQSASAPVSWGRPGGSRPWYPCEWLPRCDRPPLSPAPAIVSHHLES